MAHADVAVVGAGVMGLATAHALAAAGRDVLVLERFAVGHDRGSSHGSSRIFRLSYPEEAWVRLAQASLALWHRLETQTGERLLETWGTVDLGAWEPNRRALAAAGAAYELLPAAELGRRFGIAATDGEQGLRQPDGGILHAERAQQALARAAAADGAELLEGERVRALVPEADGVRLETDGGEHAARHVVVTAGAWARGLLAPLGIELPVTVTRETVSYFAPVREESQPSVIEIADEREPAYALAAPGLGVKAGLHQTGPAADPDEPGGPDPALAARTEAWVARRLGLPPLGRAETCLYTTTADDRFVLERHGRVVVGSACSGHGFKFAPLVGRRLAALVALGEG